MRKVKLIRDKLEPQSPHTVTMYVKGTLMHRVLLVSKLHEEVAEVADCMDDPVEYADVLQALMDLACLNDVLWEDVLAIRANKLHERGGFAAGKIMVRR